MGECEFCLYWVEAGSIVGEGRVGECRKLPPVLVDAGQTYFPEPGYADWCGAYRKKWVEQSERSN